jgi:hypothetical protein
MFAATDFVILNSDFYYMVSCAGRYNWNAVTRGKPVVFHGMFLQNSDGTYFGRTELFWVALE